MKNLNPIIDRYHVKFYQCIRNILKSKNANRYKYWWNEAVRLHKIVLKRVGLFWSDEGAVNYVAACVKYKHIN